MNEHRTAVDQTAARTAHLEQQGFTPDQIRQLEALRDVYPILEFVESNEQLQRLRFLKWQYAQHQLSG